MLFAAFLASLLLASGATSKAGQNLYRIELRANHHMLAQDRPREEGSLLLFHRHPDGLLMSLKKSEVQKVVPVAPSEPAEKRPPEKRLKAGELVILGPTGGSGSAPSDSSRPGAPGRRVGEGEKGKALLNPDRDYRPDWDSKQVPGMNMPFPASRNDYREGRTMPYPPASSPAPAPGQPPMGVQSGPPPKGPPSGPPPKLPER